MIIGIISIIIFLSILIFVHELGHFWAAKKFGLLVEEFGFGLPPKIWGKKIGETTYTINALPFGGFVKILGEDGEDQKAKENIGRSFGGLKIWKRTIIISAGVIMNFLLGWILVSLVLSIGAPKAILINEVLPNSPASGAGLIKGDKILNFENINAFVAHIEQNKGKEIVLKIERGGEEKNLTVVPRINPAEGQGALGIGLAETGFEKKNIFLSLWEGLKTSLEMVFLIFKAIFVLIGNAFSGKASLQDIAGPVGIVKVANQAGGLGIIYLIQLLALISLNLAVVNALPFPALDGGRLLFLLLEKIKGSPLPQKFERYANGLGMALLLFLMIVITIKDIASF